MNNIKIFHLDDSEEDLEIIKRRISKVFNICEITQEKRFDQFKLQINKIYPDIILSEFYLPGINGFEILDYLKSENFDIPIIFISGYMNEEIVMEALRKGASDIISKDHLNRVCNAIKRAISEHKQKKVLKETEEKLIASELKFRTLVEKSSDWIWQIDKNMQFTYSSRRVVDILGYSPEELINKSLYTFIDPEENRSKINELNKKENILLELTFLTKKETKVYIEVNTVPRYNSNGDFIGIEGVARDITARKKIYLLEENNNKRSTFLLSLSEISRKNDNKTFIKIAVEKIVDITKSNCGVIYNSGNKNTVTYFSKDSGLWNTLKVSNGKLINDFIDDELKSNNRIINNRYIYSQSFTCGKDVISIILIDKKTEYIKSDIDTLKLSVSEIDKLCSLKSYLEELKIKDLKLEEAQSIAKLGYWEWNFKNRSYNWSNNTYYITGFNKKEKPPSLKEIKKYLSDESYNKIMSSFFKSRKMCKNCSCDINVKYLKREDQWLTIRGVCNLDESGKKIGIHGTIQDITERVKKEQELKEFKEAIEQISESIVITDLQGIIVYINEAYLSISGYERDELIGKNSSILQSGKTPKETYVSMWQAITAGRTWKGFFYNKKKNNEEYVEFAIISPLKRHDGTVYRYIGIKEDITEKKKLAEDLDRYRENLEELVEERTKQLEDAFVRSESSIRAKETFLRNMSHEIRTPMNAILGMVELIKDTQLSVQQKKYIHKIDVSGKLLLNIINDILDISKIDSNMMALEKSPVYIDKVLKDLWELFNPEAVEKGLDLRIVNNSGIDFFIGDRLRISQVLINLIKNAIKFTNEGFVSVDVELIKKYKGKLFLRFSVIDTGIGIDKVDQEKLFEPFEQVDSSITRKFGGTGLGLAIVKQIIKLLGGEIGIKSEIGNGCEFWFTIIAEEGVNDISPNELSDEISINLLKPFGLLRILIAEDDETNRFVIEGLLNNPNIDLTIVENGLEAVYAVEEQSFDLIIMDMQMPVMGGLEATEKIRKSKFEENIPIIALTANAFEKDRKECMENGIDDFIVKPFRKRIIFSKMYDQLVKKYVDEKHIKDLFKNKMDKYYQLVTRLFARYENISEIIYIKDKDEIKEYAHKLKGAAGTLGLKQIAKIAKDIQMNPQNNKNLSLLIKDFNITRQIVVELN